jgi:acetyl-CoA carboxylase biotin carboxyl carrier protein
MSVEKIKDLLALMKENELAELELCEGDFKVKLKKNVAPMAMAAPIAAAPVAAPAPVMKVADMSLVPVKSPIVGTFYHAPSPDAAPFISVGDKVTKDTVVCIIEAMKIMNEIKAEISGTVTEILVENGEPVEYGQPLFMVKP